MFEKKNETEQSQSWAIVVLNPTSDGLDSCLDFKLGALRRLRVLESEGALSLQRRARIVPIPCSVEHPERHRNLQREMFSPHLLLQPQFFHFFLFFSGDLDSLTQMR